MGHFRQGQRALNFASSALTSFVPPPPQILVHPGAVTDEAGLKIAYTAFNGGPLGELVQWSDLISTIYILGHHLHLSASISDLKG